MRLLPIAVVALVATTATAAPAPSWIVDQAHSRVAFVASVSGKAVNGNFRRFNARIAFDPNNLAASSVTAMVETGSATTGDPSRNSLLSAPDWFDVPAFPRATFTSKSFKHRGGSRYQAVGSLSIRGGAKPVVLPFQLAIVGTTAQMRGTFTIDRRGFGIGRVAFPDTDTVGANVRVDIAINARKAG